MNRGTTMHHAGRRQLEHRTPIAVARALVTAALAVTAVSMMLVLAGISTAAARVVPSPQFGAVFENEQAAGGLAPEYVTLQGGPVSLQQARTLATRRFPGRVVRAETVSDGGRRVHVIRIISEDNRVRTVRIDADTGNFM